MIAVDRATRGPTVGQVTDGPRPLSVVTLPLSRLPVAAAAGNPSPVLPRHRGGWGGTVGTAVAAHPGRASTPAAPVCRGLSPPPAFGRVVLRLPASPAATCGGRAPPPRRTWRRAPPPPPLRAGWRGVGRGPTARAAGRLELYLFAACPRTHRSLRGAAGGRCDGGALKSAPSEPDAADQTVGSARLFSRTHALRTLEETPPSQACRWIRDTLRRPP